MTTRIASIRSFFRGNKAERSPEIGVVTQSDSSFHPTKQYRPGPLQVRIAPQHAGLSDDSGSEGLCSPQRELPMRGKKLPPPPYHHTYRTSKETISAPYSPQHIGLCHQVYQPVPSEEPKYFEVPLTVTPLPAELAVYRQSSFRHDEIQSVEVPNGLIPDPLSVEPRNFRLSRSEESRSSRSTPSLQIDTKLGVSSIVTSRQTPSPTVSTEPAGSRKTNIWTNWLSSSQRVSTHSHTSTPVSEKSRSSAIEKSTAILLQGEGQCWGFPGVSIRSFLAGIKCDSVKVEPIVDNQGQAGNSASSAGSSSLNSSPGSAQSTGFARQGNNKRRRNGDGGDEAPKKARRDTKDGAADSRYKTYRYGCPFVKHDPERYSNVFNACTNSPGIEWKYMLEHLNRVHNASVRCIYCKQVWTSRVWEQELKSHQNSCNKRHKIMSNPECMSAEQERVYRGNVHETGHTDGRWVALYMRLFPGTWPVPNPRYNYYIARHTLTTPRSSPSSTPTRGSDGSPQTQTGFEGELGTCTWLVFSRNHGEDSYNSPESELNYSPDETGFFSAQPWLPDPATSAGSAGNQLVPFVPNTIVPTSSHLNAGLYPDYTTIENSLMFGSDGGVGASFYEPYLPQIAGDGQGHLQGWMGQNIPQQVDFGTVPIIERPSEESE